MCFWFVFLLWLCFSLLILSAFICVHLRFLPIALAQTTAPTGLDALSDDRLISELASRGLTPLLEDGLSRAARGQTSLAEVLRVTG